MGNDKITHATPKIFNLLAKKLIQFLNKPGQNHNLPEIHTTFSMLSDIDAQRSKIFAVTLYMLENLTVELRSAPLFARSVLE